MRGLHRRSRSPHGGSRHAVPTGTAAHMPRRKELLETENTCSHTEKHMNENLPGTTDKKWAQLTHENMLSLIIIH